MPVINETKQMVIENNQIKRASVVFGEHIQSNQSPIFRDWGLERVDSELEYDEEDDILEEARTEEEEKQIFFDKRSGQILGDYNPHHHIERIWP